MDIDVQPGATYTYKLELIDLHGTSADYKNIVTITMLELDGTFLPLITKSTIL